MNSTLIVLEGLDGSGKATQARLLTDRLSGEGKTAKLISFPDYESKSSTLVQMYLAGEIGSLEQVNPFAASSFYSLDRYISYQTVWKDYYQSGGTIVADRYTTSNLSHQMGKLPREKWEDYIAWLTDYEYRLLGLPEPSMVIYLDMHPEASRLLLEERYQGRVHQTDLHEDNLTYLLACREAALFAAHRLNWHILTCSDEQHRPVPVETVARQVAALYEKR
ncbi:MAG: thymidylate kinase [Oscillospiraceae bacterium]